jgi:hypothetical protein
VRADVTPEKIRCDRCKESDKEYVARKRAMRVECPVILHNGEKCTYENINKNINKILINCHSIGIDDVDFIQNVIEHNIFCDRHLQRYLPHMHKYNILHTINNLDNFRICSSCINPLPEEAFEGNYLTCFDCRDRAESNRNDPDYKLRMYKDSAIRRGHDFNYNEEKFKLMLFQPCYYCGLKPTKNLINGVDRVNNNKGYVINNCVSCCNVCNVLKRDASIFKFINMIRHLLSYLKIIDAKYDYSIYFADHNEVSYDKLYKTYIGSAKSRKLANTLSIEQFMQIVNKPCYLCGKINSDTHKNGIDRINNDIGYDIGNIISCCYDCNMLKFVYNINEFMIHLLRIYHNRVLDEIEIKLCDERVSTYIMSKKELMGKYISQAKNTLVFHRWTKIKRNNSTAVIEI